MTGPLSKTQRKWLSEEVNSFARALLRLGQQPPSPRVRLALRRRLWSREPFFDLTLVRATVVVFFVFLYAYLSYWMAVLIRWGFILDSGPGDASGSDGSAVAQHAVVNLLLFAAVLTFGVVTIGAGAWAVFVACTVLPCTVATSKPAAPAGAAPLRDPDAAEDGED
ncbi:hypothetical protein AB9Q10_23830 [Streptomyces krungchingensis]|uniref:hypothetical protein n=1 Tax=Streptomyces krungchingensis TaxID=1565034 RepID=UPI003CF77F8C